MSHIWGLSVLCIAMAVTSNANQQCSLRIFPTEPPTWLINPQDGVSKEERVVPGPILGKPDLTRKEQKSFAHTGEFILNRTASHTHESNLTYNLMPVSAG